MRGAVAGALLASMAAAQPAQPPPPAWLLPQPQRLLLQVEPGRGRGATVATVTLDVALDPATVAVVAYDAAGRPHVFDAGDPGAGKHVVPSRYDPTYGTPRGTLSFHVPSRALKRFAVYFDAPGSTGAPASSTRYSGLVGDGDFFMEAYGRREVGPSGFDDMADIDGDGDLDLVKGGTEPTLRVFESLGARYVDRGPLSSGGQPLLLPRDERNRSWVSVELHDGDGDGDQDLFAFFMAGPHQNQVLRYENVSQRGGALTFADRGPLLTTAGTPVAGRVSFADWDGDGRTDVLAAWAGVVVLHRGSGPGPLAALTVADGTPLLANGVPLQLEQARVEAADIDGDGDLDLLAGDIEGRLFWFQNVGTRTAARLTVGRLLAFHGYMDAYLGVKVADFDGDGHLDIASGRAWERMTHGPQPRVFGRLFRNTGRRDPQGHPAFEARDASSGAPFIERLQPADALRQNGVRAADWDGDGRPDLVAGDSDGYVRLFRNRGPQKRPTFEAPVFLEAAGTPIKVWGEEPEGRAAGYARPDVADWNGDGRLDLVVADGRGWVTFFPNQGTRRQPKLGAGRRLGTAAAPIDGTSRGSVLVADWDGDGRQDLLVAMVGEGPSRSYDWPRVHHGDPSQDRGLLFYRNVGTANAPLLGPARWINAGTEGKPLDLERPNLGDVLDWDGDGQRDLLACEFETSCRVFLNTGPAPDGRPRLRGSPAGLTVLKPATAQTISGADAFDWDGDGRQDLLTGQGHAGSGLRFFARGYLDDLRAGRLPRVTVEREERRPGTDAGGTGVPPGR